MSRASAAWRLAMVAGLTACGTASSTLPAATPVSMTGAGGSVPAVGTIPSVEPVTSAHSDPTPTSIPVTTENSRQTATAATFAPTTGFWTNATDGLVGLPSECGNLSLVATRPDQDMLIASVAQQGLWSSVHGTDAWSKLGTGAGSATIINRGGKIVFDPAYPATFWESGIYNGGGVYRTDDGGSTFRQLGNISHVEGFSVDLSDPARSTLLATIHESSQTFRSTDGGNTWTDISNALPTDIGFVSSALVIDGRTFLLGAGHSTGSKLLRSTNAGVSWEAVYDGGVAGAPLRANADGTIYWVLEAGGLMASIDSGQTWTPITPKTDAVPTAISLVELPDANLASVDSGYVIISADHGASWTAIGPQMSFNPTGMIYSPFRKAFYVWHFDCDFSTADPIQPDSIMRLDADLTHP